MGLLKMGHEGGLGRLHRPQMASVEGSQTALALLFDRVGDRQGRRRRPVPPRDLDDAGDQVGGDEGSGAVVQNEDLGVHRRVEGGAGARLARLASQDRRPRLGQLGKVVRVPDEDRPIDGRMGGVSVVGVTPNGLAPDGEGELIAAEPNAPSGAQDRRDDAQARRPPPPRRGIRPPGYSSPSISAKIILPRSV